MLINVNTRAALGEYRDPTRWQNNTLRYSPPRDFPAFLSKTVGRARVMRSFITLDEYWDYRTGEFYPDYDIGVKRYPDSELHYVYDWRLIVPAPSGIRFVDYLTTHAAEADELLLNVRRLERETLDGVISEEAYEAVLEKAVAYCKQLAPNIRYIECCNEVDIKSFGRLHAAEYLRLYRIAHRVIRRLNAENNYEMPLMIGGWSVAMPFTARQMWERFLELLAADDSIPTPKIDFYSEHYYNQGEAEHLTKFGLDNEALSLAPPDRIKLIYSRHKANLKRLGLPNGPFFLNEMGYTRTTGVLTDALRNSSGNVTFFIAAADEELDGLYMFPWCTFHNPELQISYTQFVLRDGKYLATPNGMVILMFYRMKGERVEVTVENCTAPDARYRAQAVKDGDKTYVICANTSASADVFDISLDGLDGDYRVVEYLCDSKHNNCVTSDGNGALTSTDERVIHADGTLRFSTHAEPYAFAMFEIDKK